MGTMGITYDIYTVSEDMIGSMDPTGSNQGKCQPETIPEILGPAKKNPSSTSRNLGLIGFESMGYTP